jgi:hypothetical protein
VSKPELKQFGDMTNGDFDRHPVWVSCHVIDYDEPWYEETDEETFRPWLGDLPVDPTETMFLIRAEFRDPSGRIFAGFITPAETADLGQIQPQLLHGSQRFSFWGGMSGVSEEERAAFYDAMGVAPEQAFPLQFHAAPGLASGVTAGMVEGFYRKPKLSAPPLLER